MAVFVFMLKLIGFYNLFYQGFIDIYTFSLIVLLFVFSSLFLILNSKFAIHLYIFLYFFSYLDKI